MVVRTFQIVAGMSVNGKIADEGGSFQDYSSVEDQQFLQQKIEESDVLIMGRRTFDIHSGFAKKPVIIFTRSVSGIVMGEGPMHYFHDSEEELLNLIELLQYRSITILGGSEIYHWFLQSCLVT
ncbi:MAG: dihydrofolate reductase, partial [bacterium]|nr:dihydrofolate reductase [bacterium]